MPHPKNKLSTTPYRGTRDFYPSDMQFRNWMFHTMRQAAESFGYEQYDGPMLEAFELYAAKSGEELVNEQLYHFEDRGGRRVAIRPEMTPTVARMVAARLNELAMPIRWFALPNLWRYEKPQRGRLREHWQFNADIFGVDSVTADHEILEVAIAILQGLGGTESDFHIHISNRRMLNHFLEEILQLDEKGRSLTCKAIDKRAKISPEAFQEMLRTAGLPSEKISDLDAFMNLDFEKLQQHSIIETPGGCELKTLFELLQSSGKIKYCVFDPSIVRGLDYYTGTVFEMYDRALENRRALFGGGRYDDLVGMFTNAKIPGVGFGMGDVTIQDFVESHCLTPALKPAIEVFIALYDADGLPCSYQLSDRLRKSGFRTAMQLEELKIGKQFKFADQKKIPIVLIQGPDERSGDQITVKHLPTGSQTTVASKEIEQTIRNLI